MGDYSELAKALAKYGPAVAGVSFPIVSAMHSSDYERNMPSSLVHFGTAAGVGVATNYLAKTAIHDFNPGLAEAAGIALKKIL